MRTRLVVSYVSITLIVVLALGLPLAFLFARTERRALSDAVRRDALALSIRAEEPLESGNTSGLQAQVDQYQRDTGARVVVVDQAGNVVADSDPARSGARNFASRAEITKALSGQEVTGARYSSTLGTNLFYAAVPVSNGAKIVGAVRVSYTTEFVDGRIRTSWLLLAAAAFGVVVVVALVSVWLARSVTKPVAELEAGANRLGRGDLAARVPVPNSPPELRSLAESFNRTAAQVEELVDGQRAFVADASHQLRTPLAALRLRLENLEGAVAEPDRDDLEGAVAEVGRLSRLVDGLLALARAEGAPTAPEPVALSALVDDRVAAWEAYADERSVRLAASVPNDVRVLATPGHLDQVFDNVFANALAVVPDASTVAVSTRAAANGVVTLVVTDEGPGMTDEQRRRAFDRFWRAGASDGRGSGLGLPIVRELVRADGGDVALEAAPSGGLAVVISLRRAD
ncbi:MAG: ATP-binding protein [Acidimicrobiia bacterium]